MNTPLQAQADVSRVAPIERGRSDYLSVLCRLVGMDLYKVRRRLLSKVLLLVGTGLIVFLFLTLGIGALHVQSQPVTSFVPDSCSRFPLNPNCINHPATLADMRHAKQVALDGVAVLLNMPGSWAVIAKFALEVFAVLAIILAGTLTGGEYSLGTVRLMFTRGPTRIQFLLAKVAVMVIYLVPAVLFWVLLGSVIGGVMADLAGIGAGLSFLTSAVVGHFVLFLLLMMLYCLAYMAMALFFGTVGRSTVAGIVGPLVWLATEPVLGSIITALTQGSSGGLADFLKAIPTYFPGSNLSQMLHDHEHALSIGIPNPPDYSAAHSALTVAAYLIVFVGVACWVTGHRDVTQ